MKTLLKIALVTLVASAAAQAAEPRAVLTVAYTDLNLESPAGARVLMSRLKGAARDVCRSEAGAGLNAYAHHDACYERALKDAVASINKPTVNALYRQAHQPAQG